jgi:GTP-binding protein HflX
MFDIKERPKQVERALLIGVYKDGEQKEESESLLAELDALVDTLEIPVIDRLLVKVQARNARYFVGSGKAEEIAERAKQLEIDVIVFDNGLSPAQQRNWEALTGVAVIDREEVILDIFGRRARTKEARLQVDLARMEYSLPRLTRAWSHLSRQGGGLGGKGEGETQLESDRRLVRAQIDRLKSDLELVRLRRATQRKQRQRLPLPSAAIVGYTNVGKSALLKKLTGAQVLVEDKLFATLDTTTRRVLLPSGQSLLLTDTVGFVRNLPHRLIEAFKATLEEAVLSDFLIHVLDASHPRVFDWVPTRSG